MRTGRGAGPGANRRKRGSAEACGGSGAAQRHDGLCPTTLWPLAIKGLGRWTNLGSSLLVMALCGNAIMSLLYGLEADRLGEHAAYWLLVPCFVYMIFYAIYGHKIGKASK